tara:strand:+ start:730 stop:984 length:255 start_codon:yes stop_codon:yes gene_type:complete
MQIGFSKKISENLLDDIINVLIDNLIKNKKVKISNFGTFTVRSKKERIGRNPKSRESKVISNRNVVLFKPSTKFKDFVNLDLNE